MAHYKKQANAPNRLPTPAECMEAIENPKKAKPWVKEYLQHNPDYRRHLQSLISLEERIRKLSPQEAERMLKKLQRLARA